MSDKDINSQKLPKLRFKEFHKEWTEIGFGEFLIPELRPIAKPTKPYLAIGVRSHFKGLFHKPKSDPNDIAMDTLFIVNENDLVINITFGWEGAVAIAGKNDAGGLVSHRFPTYIFKKEICIPEYFKFVFPNEKFKNELSLISPGGAGRNRVLSKKDLPKIKFVFPEKTEQEKIAAFLYIIDEKINKLSEKKSFLERYKKGVMQKIFSQKIKFLDKNGNKYPEWEEVSLFDISTRVKRKNSELNTNVLTISGQLGLVNQEEYFNKSISAKDTSKYYLIHEGEFAYNKSYSKGYPMGAIKCLNKFERGVVSTLYICFKFKDPKSNLFFQQYFESGLQNPEIEKVAQEGARNHGLLNIGIDDFFNIKIHLPSIPEQENIAQFLTEIDRKIESISQTLSEAEKWKKGLLQNMFV